MFNKFIMCGLLVILIAVGTIGNYVKQLWNLAISNHIFLGLTTDKHISLTPSIIIY